MRRRLQEQSTANAAMDYRRTLFAMYLLMLDRNQEVLRAGGACLQHGSNRNTIGSSIVGGHNHAGLRAQHWLERGSQGPKGHRGLVEINLAVLRYRQGNGRFRLHRRRITLWQVD